MTQQMIDFPMELAQKAYAHSKVPDKAAREQTAFEEHMERVHRELREFAKTERQQHLLDQLMYSYRRTYVAELTTVLETRMQTPEHTMDDKKLSQFGAADFAFRQWQRRARRDMEYDLRAVEQPDARWTKRAGLEVKAALGQSV